MDNFLAVNVVGVVDLNYSYVRVGYLTEVLVALLCVENRYGNCNLLDLRLSPVWTTAPFLPLRLL